MLSTRISLIILVILSPFHLISFCLKRTNAVQCHSDSRYGYFGTNFKSEAHFARFDWNDNKILCLLYCSRIRTFIHFTFIFLIYTHFLFGHLKRSFRFVVVVDVASFTLYSHLSPFFLSSIPFTNTSRKCV